MGPKYRWFNTETQLKFYLCLSVVWTIITNTCYIRECVNVSLQKIKQLQTQQEDSREKPKKQNFLFTHLWVPIQASWEYSFKQLRYTINLGVSKSLEPLNREIQFIFLMQMYETLMCAKLFNVCFGCDDFNPYKVRGKIQ